MRYSAPSSLSTERSAQSALCVRTMVQHASADDQVESTAHEGAAFARQLLRLEIAQIVSALHARRVVEARRADVDADDASAGPAEGVLGGLPGAAPRDEDVQIRAVHAARPEQVVLGPVAVRLLPFVTGPVEVLDRRRVGVVRVEIADWIDA